MKILRQGIHIILTILLVAGCAGHEDIADTPDAGTGSSYSTEGYVWLPIEIDMGSTVVTRDAATEETVANAFILIFSGNGAEDDAKLVAAAKAEVDGRKVVRLARANIPTSGNLYALALINVPGTTVSATGITINGGEEEQKFNTATFGTIKKLEMAVQNTIGETTGCFLMSNAPVSDKAGGQEGAKLTTLTPIDRTHLHPTEAAANTCTSGPTIYVERAAAKVTVSAPTSGTIGSTGIDFATDDIAWTLDRTNKKSYLVGLFTNNAALQYNNSEKGYRFADATPYPTGVYRTYWRQDMNYGDGDDISGLIVKTADTDFDSQSTYYIAENTMDDGNLKQDRTTALLVRLTLNGGFSFYTSSDQPDQPDIPYSEPENATEEWGTTPSESLSRPRRSTKQSAKAIDVHLYEWLIASDGGNLTSLHEGQEAQLTWTITKDEDNVCTVTVGCQDGAASVTQDFAAAATTKLKDLTIRYYEDGKCYYRGLIKHFGDELTPWTAGASNNSYDNVYAYDGQRENKYLGRYGVVRNHHYQLTINSFTHIGWPVIPPVKKDGTPLTNDNPQIKATPASARTRSAQTGNSNEQVFNF